LGGLGVDVRIILKWILAKLVMAMWIGLNMLRVGFKEEDDIVKDSAFLVLLIK
jgi:hypothetical protein